MGAVGFVSGSGIDLSPLLRIHDDTIPFPEVIPVHGSRVPGHSGVFYRGRCGEQEVVVQSGRLHIYEGLSYRQVVSTVDALVSFGVTTIVFTNAVGGLQPEHAPGTLICVREIQAWPFNAWRPCVETLTPTRMIQGCDCEGRYIWVPGPNYETRAEIRALQSKGGTVVGMSTAPEVQRCLELGIECAVISCVTNSCCNPQVLTHEHVIEAARAASTRLCGLLTETFALR